MRHGSTMVVNGKKVGAVYDKANRKHRPVAESDITPAIRDAFGSDEAAAKHIAESEQAFKVIDKKPKGKE